MEISVIIPSYKPQDYLWRCLDSLDGQTLAKDKFEVILVLNGCKEPYHGQILNYIEKHKDMKIRYEQRDSDGVSFARNIGIELAEGRHLTFIDDDDYVSPRYLEALLEVGGGQNCVYIQCRGHHGRQRTTLRHGASVCAEQAKRRTQPLCQQEVHVGSVHEAF